ncbi:MAG: hypothetical protein ACOYJB_06695 [Christensenellaceae bacterium]|jgi:hypothetical protein
MRQDLPAAQPAKQGYKQQAEAFDAFIEAQETVVRSLAQSRKEEREEDELKQKLLQVRMMADGLQKQQMIAGIRKAMSQLGYVSVEMQRMSTAMNEMERGMQAEPECGREAQAAPKEA